MSTEEAPLSLAKALDLLGHSTDNRRTRERRPFLSSQMVGYPAEANGRAIDSSFERVCCMDIGVGGFSFLSSRRPPSQELVASLSGVHGELRVRAELTHVHPVMHHNRRMYLVGCRFVEKVEDADSPASPPATASA